MTALGVDDFATFFRAVHGRTPFPWQARLLRQVAAEGRWPSLLDLPTGAGKTAALDVALFHLALDGGARAPRRIVMVVDRRTIVDQSFRRGEAIRSALQDSDEPVVREVAARLRALTANAAPALLVAQLRGGMPRDDAWARRPDQPVIGVSTVDQVGSRVLFRGYGVSEGMRPIHAGLLGADTLILLDEVHLSQPFLETLSAIERYQDAGASPLPRRWQVVPMSATAASPGERPFSLGDDDRADAVLSRRLRASKPATRVAEPVRGKGARGDQAFASACVEQALAMLAPGGCTGVLVNRVDTARLIHHLMREARPDARMLLVTGRMRPLDRADREESLMALAGSDRERQPDSPPAVVVATQCVEAGADLDFDALVTECASLDALRQRFGRLNRLGSSEATRGVVLARAESLEVDPIYGVALGKTWAWLGEGEVDFGIQAIEVRLPKGDRLKDCLAPKGRAPVMLPAHLDAWSQTRPAPEPDPEISLWLHGVEPRSQPEVHLVWRGDLVEAQLQPSAVPALVSRLEACAPVGLEALTLPLYAARAWLAGQPPRPIADVEGADEEPGEEPDEPKPGRPALSWRGHDGEIVSASGVRPGMTLVVPALYGGLSDGNWDPSSKAAVADLAHRARRAQTGKATLRLVPEVLPRDWPAPPRPDPGRDAREDRKQVSEWLSQVASLPGSDVEAELGKALAKARRNLVVRSGGPDAAADELPIVPSILTVISRSRVAGVSADAPGSSLGDDDDASLTGVEVTLSAHMCGVERWARTFAAQCGLPGTLVEVLALAARWHDAGKADPRFQRMLRGAAAFLADSGEEPLAKSGVSADDAASRRRAHEVSRYPKGARHELASIALLEAEGSLLAAAERVGGDRELLLHLVASHHGWCRPFAPCAPDPDPVTVGLDMGGRLVEVSSDHGLAAAGSGVADRFWRLTERYGWFGLAWLEAILRLADHRQSEAEQRASADDEGGAS